MDEKPQIIASPEAVEASGLKKSDGNKTPLILAGVMLLLVVFVGAIFILT